MTNKIRFLIGHKNLISIAISMFLLISGTGMARAAALPLINNYVTDEAGLLSPQERMELESLLRDFDRQTSNQLLVVTISGLPEGESLEGFSIKLADALRAGTAEEDNGAIILIAREQREVRIEVGYGLEDKITDGRAGRIIRQVIAPAFQKGAYQEGISGALLTMINWIDSSYLPAEVSSRLPAPNSETGGGLGFVHMFILFWLFIGISSIVSRADRRRWSRRGYSQNTFGPVVFLPRSGRRGGSGGFGGFSRGGGFSGGGGGFGGGGASGGW